MTRRIAFACAPLALAALLAAPAPAPAQEASPTHDVPPAAAGALEPGPGGGQAPAGDPIRLDEQREAMARLDDWVGEWQGTGWAMGRAGRRQQTAIRETVESKLGGLAILVQGLGTTPHPETGEETVTHDALGVVTYDPHGDRYLFRYYSAEGRSGETELVPVEGGWRWGFTAPGGGPEVRFTIELGATTWRERGEVSMDGGESWFPMLEMSLQKQSG